MQRAFTARVAFPRHVSIHAPVARSRAVLCLAGRLRLEPCGDGSVGHIKGAVDDLPDVGAIELTEGIFEVGRVEPAEIVLGLPTVSGRHALLSVDESGAVAVTDLGSTNGTKIDGAELEPMRAVS